MTSKRNKLVSLIVLFILVMGCVSMQTTTASPVPTVSLPTAVPTLTMLPATEVPAATASLAPNPPTPEVPTATVVQPIPFSFAVTADMRYFTGPGQYNTPAYFRGVLEAIAPLGTAFMVTPGDIDNPWDARWSIDQTLGKNYIWFPGPGNHENLAKSMDWLRHYNPDLNGDAPPNIVDPGPSSCPQTNYSFDYQNAHFVMLNEYCDALNDMTTYGDVGGTLLNWLEADLAATKQEHVFVIGHEPAYPQADVDTGRVRHEGESLDKDPQQRDRFWAILRERGVKAYICGHTHDYSAVQVDGVWQIDAAHARGLGDPEVPSTFVIIKVDGARVTFDTYRSDTSGVHYSIRHQGTIAPS